MGLEYKLILEHAINNKNHYKNVIKMIDRDKNSKKELIAAGYTEDEAFKTLFIIHGEFLSSLALK